MDKKEGVLFFLVAGLLVVSSCAGPAEAGTLPKGLDFKFLPEQPPGKLIDSQDFQVFLEVENSLEKPVPFEVCIHDSAPPNYNGIPPECKTGTIDGAYINNQGQITSAKLPVYFPAAVSYYSYDFPANTPVKSTTVHIELKYTMVSTASVDVCLSSDPILKREDGIDCKTEENFVSIQINQESAPLTISNLKKTIIGSQGVNKMILDIQLTKEQKGSIVRQQNLELDFLELDLIDMEVYLTGTEAIFSCGSDQYGDKVAFRAGDPIRCIADLNLVGTNFDYRDSLIISLGYTYKVADNKIIVFDDTNLRERRV